MNCPSQQNYEQKVVKEFA